MARPDITDSISVDGSPDPMPQPPSGLPSIGERFTADQISSGPQPAPAPALEREPETVDLGRGLERIYDEAGINVLTRAKVGAFFDKTRDRPSLIRYLSSIPSIQEVREDPDTGQILVRNQDGKLRKIDPAIGGFGEPLLDLLADNPKESIATALTMIPIVGPGLGSIARAAAIGGASLGATEVAAQKLQGPMTGQFPSFGESALEVAEQTAIGAGTGAVGEGITKLGGALVAGGRAGTAAARNKVGDRGVFQSAYDAASEFLSRPETLAKNFGFSNKAYAVQSNRVGTKGFKRPDGTIAQPPKGPLDNLVYLRDKPLADGTEFIVEASKGSNREAAILAVDKSNELTSEMLTLIDDEVEDAVIGDIFKTSNWGDLIAQGGEAGVKKARGAYKKTAKLIEDSLMELPQAKAAIETRQSILDSVAAANGTKSRLLTRKEKLEAIKEAPLSSIDAFKIKTDLQGLVNYDLKGQVTNFANRALKNGASAMREAFQSVIEDAPNGVRILELEENLHNLIPVRNLLDKSQMAETGGNSLLTSNLPSPLFSLYRAAAQTTEKVLRSPALRKSLFQRGSELKNYFTAQADELAANVPIGNLMGPVEVAMSLMNPGMTAAGRFAGVQIGSESYRKNIQPFIDNRLFREGLPRETRAAFEDPDVFVFEVARQTEDFQLAQAMDDALAMGDEELLENLMTAASVQYSDLFDDPKTGYSSEINGQIKNSEDQQSYLNDMREKNASLASIARQASRFNDRTRDDKVLKVQRKPKPKAPTKIRTKTGTAEAPATYGY